MYYNLIPPLFLDIKILFNLLKQCSSEHPCTCISAGLSCVLSFSYITTFGFHFIFYEVYWEENVLLWGTWQNYCSNWMIKLASECKWCLWEWRKEQTGSQGLVHPLSINWQWMTHPKEQNSLTWKYRAVSSTSKSLLAVSFSKHHIFDVGRQEVEEREDAYP